MPNAGIFNLPVSMKKFEIISRIGIIGFGLCVAAAVFAEKPASTSASPSPASKAKGGSRLSAKDKTFMMNADKGGQMEVEWGKLAAQNGQSADVKNFGNRMVTDHSKANNELMNLAKEEGVSLPVAKPPGKWKSDKDYINMMVKDHEKDLAEFQNEASNGTDPDLKRFAGKYSKVVTTHLDLARGIQGKLK
jgi:putative membrane protein